MQQRLPELQPERGGGERGPPEGHPDLEGASHRHLQVRTGEGEAEEQIHPPEGAWGPAWGACPPWGARAGQDASAYQSVRAGDGEIWDD